MAEQLNQLKKLKKKKSFMVKTPTSPLRSSSKKNKAKLERPPQPIDTTHSRFLIINRDVHEYSFPNKKKEEGQEDEDDGDVIEMPEEIKYIDPTRGLMSEKREVQLAWQALLRVIIDKHMRIRDFFDKLDKDKSGSLDYHEFESGLRQFKDLFNYVSSKHVEKLIQSLYPEKDSEVTWEIFDRIVQMYAAKHFPKGTYGEWAGTQLIDTRITLKEAYKNIQKEKEVQRGLLSQIDELKLIQLKGEEYYSELKNCRAQNATLVKVSDESKRMLASVLEDKKVLTKIKHDLETQVVDLEAQVAEYEGEMMGKGVHLHNARQQVMSVEEELALARIQMQKMTHQIDDLELNAKTMSKTIEQYQEENTKLKAAQSIFMRDKEDSLRSNHALEMRILALEQSRKEVIGQFYNQKIKGQEIKV